MKNTPVWYYAGTFTLTLVSEESARFAPHEGSWRLGRTVRIHNGKIRYSHVGFEFRTQHGLPFYFVPHLIGSLRTRWRSLEWHKQEKGHFGVCRRCGGSGSLLRPQRRKLLTFITCSTCGGKGLKNIAHNRHS